MSGRAYARTPQGFLGGGADLESTVPHTFRVAPPKRSNSVREMAIRRVIRRRCMEKNWKKIISRRHSRLESGASEPPSVNAPAAIAAAAAAGAPAVEENDKAVVANGTTKAPERKESSGDTKTAAAEQASAIAVENGARKPKQEKKKPDSETLTLAKRQLEELEAKLKTLVEQKHAKFLQLKTILVEEARSKTSTPTPAPAASTPVAVAAAAAAAVAVPAAKKRRVDGKELSSAANPLSPQPQGEQSAAPQPGSPLPAASTGASANKASSPSATDEAGTNE